MHEAAERVWVEPNYEEHKLDPEQRDHLQLGMDHIFTHPTQKPSRLQSEEERIKNIARSKYQRIMPEDLPKPMLGRRIRVFRGGYDVQLGEGFKSGDHIIGVAMTYRNSRPHYLSEIYYGNKTKGDRYFLHFIPHLDCLKVACETAGQSELLTEPNIEQSQDDDVMILLGWMREVYDSKKGFNRYSPGMRHGRLHFIMPELV